MLDRGRVDGEKAQRLTIENVHRHRMIIEQAAKTLVVAAKRADGAQLLARAAFAGAEREDQKRATAQHRHEQQKHGSPGLARGNRERRLQRPILLLA